jgi:long-chain acyl-CoA synthetase
MASRSTELVGLWTRERWRTKKTGNSFLNELRSRNEAKSTSKLRFDTLSTPMIAKGAKWLSKLIDERKPTWGAPKISAMLDHAKEALEDVTDDADRLNLIVDLFLPFIWENRFIFRCDNTRSLYVDMPAHDRAKINWNPDTIDWRRYFLDVHIPGLAKWVFPGLDEETEKRKALPAYRDLIELFEASVHAWRHRVAFRFHEGDDESRLTYGEVQRYAMVRLATTAREEHAAGVVREEGTAPGVSSDEPTLASVATGDTPARPRSSGIIEFD